MTKSITTRNSELEIVRQQFEAWRNGRSKRTEPIPEKLWQGAADLCKSYSINKVSRLLHLSYADLKKRVLRAKPINPRFVEVDLDCVIGNWQLECHRADGASLRICGSVQLSACGDLLRQFLA